MKVDAHHHLWTPSKGWYGWMSPELGEPLYHTYTPADLAPQAKAAGVDATIVVQASETVAETRFMLESAAASNGLVQGVIGWVNFEDGSGAGDLAALKADPLFKGVRPMVQDIPDPSWMLRDDIRPTVQAVQDQDLIFEALVRPPQWDALIGFLDRYPNLRTVIDHAAKPSIRDGKAGFDAWAPKIKAMSERGHVLVKLSALLGEANPGANASDLRPFVDHLFECFGAERIMWGSDWPVLRAAPSEYADWVSMSQDLTSDLSAAEKDAVFGGVAAKFYRLA